MRFVLPHENAVRPWWMVRLGLYLYDWLGGRMTLKRSRGLRSSDTAYTTPLKHGARGFVYSDAFVDDSRLTVLNAVDAHDNGAGPWVAQLLARLRISSSAGVRLVKGSHIVVPKLYDGHHAYILQLADRRIVFAIPYQGQTEIGTTDIPVDRPEYAVIDGEEIAYLCDAANQHFIRQITPADVTSTWPGVRPLYDDGAGQAKAVTRDYVLELDTNGATLLSVFGGKITTARHLAEEALAKIAPTIDRTVRPATRERDFTGGAIPPFATYLGQVRTRWPFLGEARSERMAHTYGGMLFEMLGEITDIRGLGADLEGGLTEIEARWMRNREWARIPEDALMRRSKIGLYLTSEQKTAFATWWNRAFPRDS